MKPGTPSPPDADAIGGVLVFRSGDATVVTDATQRRDARKRSAPPEAVGVDAAVDRVWTPGHPEDEGPKRVN
jgi:hypothetical protein